MSRGKQCPLFSAFPLGEGMIMQESHSVNPKLGKPGDYRYRMAWPDGGASIGSAFSWSAFWKNNYYTAGAAHPTVSTLCLITMETLKPC